MDELRRMYRQALPARIAALETARTNETGGIVEIRRIAHTLRGSGGTYGFPEVSESAHAVEKATDDELQGRLDALLAVLRHIASATDGAE